MAAISKTLEIRDKMSKRVNAITKQLDRLNKTSKTTDKHMKTLMSDNSTIKQKEKALGVLDRALQRNSKYAQNMSKEIDSVNKSLSKLNEGKSAKNPIGNLKTPIDSVNNGLIGWQNQLVGFIGKLITVQALMQGISKLTELTNDYTQSKARLNLVNDSNQTTDELTNKIWQSAQRSGSEYQPTRDMVTQISMNAPDTFGSNDEAIGFAELINKSFDIAGTSDSGKESVIYNLTQALSSGTLRGQDLNSVLQNAPNIVQNIADYLETPVGQIKELASEGKITAGIVKNAMFAASDEINTNFEKIPMTWARIGTEIKNTIYMLFVPVFQQLEDLANSPAIEGFKTLVLSIISTVATVVGYIVSAVSSTASWVAGVVSNNIETVKLVLSLLIGVLSALAAKAIITGIITAGSFMLSHMPLMLLIAGIALIIFILHEMGVTADNVLKFIGGTLGWLYGVVFNIIAQIWNIVATFAESIANFFHDPLGSIVRLFAGLADSVLGLLETIAGGIDAVFGSNLSSAISGWRDGLSDMVAEKFGEPEHKVARMEEKNITQTKEQGIEVAHNLGKGFQNFQDKMAAFSGGIDYNKFGAGDVDEVGEVGSVGKIESDVNIAEEDIKLLKDVAMLDFQVNLAHSTPTNTQYNTFGDIKNGVDTDQMIDIMNERFVAAVTGDTGYGG